MTWTTQFVLVSTDKLEKHREFYFVEMTHCNVKKIADDVHRDIGLYQVYPNYLKNKIGQNHVHKISVSLRSVSINFPTDVIR